jgi:Thiamine pyrophosphate enzyme, C-terminal TPP binding domain
MRLPALDFAAIAQATGLFGARVEKAGELDDALRAAFDHDGPALVDVRTDRHELSFPPKLTYGEIKGFTLYTTRTICRRGELSSSSWPSPTCATSRWSDVPAPGQPDPFPTQARWTR